MLVLIVLTSKALNIVFIGLDRIFLRMFILIGKHMPL